MNSEKGQKKLSRNIRLLLVALSVVIIVIIVFGVKHLSTKKLENSIINDLEDLSKDDKYNLLDVEFDLDFRRVKDTGHGKYREYDLTIFSLDFETLTNDKKYSFINSLDLIKDNGIFWVKVVSDDNFYDLSSYPDETLNKNDNVIYVHRKNEKTNETSITYETEPSEEDKGYSWAVAIKEVKENLKSPSTATFPKTYSEEDIKEVDTNTFVVKSYVDAQNSFGAEIRTNFMVKIKKTGENTYNLLDIKIYE